MSDERYIHNTTSIDWLKKQATSLKKAQSIKQTQALDMIAVEHGFDNWKSLIASAEPLSDTPASTDLMDLLRDTFDKHLAMLQRHINDLTHTIDDEYIAGFFERLLWDGEKIADAECDSEYDVSDIITFTYDIFYDPLLEQTGYELYIDGQALVDEISEAYSGDIYDTHFDNFVHVNGGVWDEGVTLVSNRHKAWMHIGLQKNQLAGEYVIFYRHPDHVNQVWYEQRDDEGRTDIGLIHDRLSDTVYDVENFEADNYHIDNNVSILGLSAVVLSQAVDEYIDQHDPRVSAVAEFLLPRLKDNINTEHFIFTASDVIAYLDQHVYYLRINPTYIECVDGWGNDTDEIVQWILNSAEFDAYVDAMNQTKIPSYDGFRPIDQWEDAQTFHINDLIPKACEALGWQAVPEALCFALDFALIDE